MGGQGTIRLGTRGSLLARTQSGMVADDLRRCHPGLEVELVIVKTSGDQLIDRSLADLGGKGLFTKELELALLANSIDMAVHSMKDVPVTLPLVPTTELIIAATPLRQDPRDVLVSKALRDLSKVPANGRIGTGSTRRRCQLLQACPGVVIEPLRGNVDTRLEQARSGAMDGVVLAMAGLIRLGKLDSSWMIPLSSAQMLPAAGQGALTLQCRSGDDRTRRLLAALHDRDTGEATSAERAVVANLNGDCHSPIAVLASFEGDQLVLEAAVGGRDGNLPVIRANATTARRESQRAVEITCDSLRRQGAVALLAGQKVV